MSSFTPQHDGSTGVLVLAVGSQTGGGRRALSAALIAALAITVLAGCAQTNALFDGTTGALGPPSQVAQAGATPGEPPLPARRKPSGDQAAGDSLGILAALPDIDLSAPSVAPASVVTQDKPVDVYVRVARQIRRCWLGPDDPTLPGHGFRARATPGEAGEAEIDIYKEVPGRKYGPYAFEVKISPQAGGSLVRSTNRRLDEALANALRRDLAAWVRGGSACDTPGRDNA